MVNLNETDHDDHDESLERQNLADLHCSLNYNEYFKLRKDASSMWSVVNAWLDRFGVPIIVDSMLSIGSGDGETDIKIVRSWKRENPEEVLRYVSIEPHSAPASRLHGRITKLIEESVLSSSSKVFECCFLEDSPFRTDDTERFSLAMFMHCIHLFPDPLVAIDRARRVVDSEHGHVLIIIGSKQGVPRLHEQLFGKHFLTAEDLEVMLKKNNVPFKKEELAARMEVTELLHGSVNGIKAFTFILNMTPPTTSAVEALKAAAYEDPIGSHRWWLNEHVCTFLLPSHLIHK